MGDLTQKERSGAVKLVGADQFGNETNFADIELINGKFRLLTSSIASVEQIFGFDNQADSWFAIGGFQDSTGIGGVGDQIRMEIAAGDNATLFPAIDLTYTVTAADIAAADKEITVAQNMVNFLNADSVFSDLWKAKRVKDNSTVHISSKLLAEFGQRPNAGDFKVTVTGTTIVTVAFDRVERKGKRTSLSRDPRDPRIGILGITGEVTTIPGAIGDLFILNSTASGLNSMIVDGSTTPVNFTLDPSATKDIFIRELRFFGGGNGIKFGNFLSQNSPLINGIKVTIRSDSQVQVLPLIRNTEDFKNKFAFGGGGPGASFRIDVQAGQDEFIAAFIFETPFPIRREGTFTLDDIVEIKIQDDLTSGLASLELIGFGFEREV